MPSIRERLNITSPCLGWGWGVRAKKLTADALEGGHKPKLLHADTFKGRDGRVETYIKYCCKILVILVIF